MAETVEQWAARQPDLSNIESAMERKNALESWQKERPGYVDPMDYKTYDEYAVAANPRNKEFGTGSGAELQNQANFYGMTVENYLNALSGDSTKPMGGNQAVYGAQLLSPLEQKAAETARGQGISTMSPETAALAKANPDVFNAASQRFQNYLATTYPGTLEYQSVLSGPMQFSNAGVRYPKIDDTVSMYILDPVTNEIVKNPKYKGPKTAADGGLMSLTDSPKQSGLHQFAQQVAANGRGDDSLLVHMTPDEVRNLQRFAEANGTTLTINPETGLPEAGLLSDLFKAVAPIALGAFLGPAGLGMSAGMAGLATGGITALATGSLSRGLMAGLGAYGGAGLGAGLGASATATGTGSAFELANQGAGAGVAATPTVAGTAENFMTGIKGLGTEAGRTAAIEGMGGMKGALTTAGMVASPILAASMVPTTTKLETPKSDNYIRQFDFNINPETGKPDPLYGVRAMTPVKASEFGDKTLQGQRDLFRQQNPNPYEMGVGSLNQPPQQPARMAGGGIVALANGGIPGYADGALVSDKQIFDYFAAPTPGRTDADIARDMQTYNVTAADIARATGTGARQGEYETRFVQAINKPDTSAQEFQAMTADVGLQNQALENAMQNAGMSQAAQYAATHNLTDTKAPQTDFYNQFGYKLGALPGDQGGLEGYYSNINYSAQGLQSLIDAGKMTGQQAREAALTEMNRIGMSAADLKAATGKTLAELFPDTKVKPPVVVSPPFTSVVPGGTQLPGATVYDNGAFGNYGSGPKTGTDYLGREVSIATPGDIITNPDGTRTVVPNIPGRPYGGFTGMDQVKSAYTAGGGSLGYTAKAPRTIAEFNQLYNKQTGDSLAAYNYLMGKGANNNAYPVKSGVSEIQKPYNEFVLGKKTSGLKPAAATVKQVVGVPGQPQTYFNEAEYLAANPDVAAELKTGKSVSGQPTKFTSAYEHWLMYGKNEGRPFAGDYQGYLTAAALASAAGAGGGGEGPSPVGPNNSNTISGFTPAPPNDSIPVSDMGPPATDGDDGDDGDGGSTNAKRGGLMPRGYATGGITGDGNLNLHIPLDFGNGGGGGYSAAGSGGGGIGSIGLTGNTGGFGGQNNTAGGGFGATNPYKNYQNTQAQINQLPSVAAYNNYTNSIGGNQPTADQAAQIEQLRKNIVGDPGYTNLVSRGAGLGSAPQQGGYGGIPPEFMPTNRGSSVNTTTTEDMMGAIGALTQQQNAAARASYANANPASMSDLAKRLGYANGGMTGYAMGGGLGSLGTYSDGGRLLKGPGDGVSDSIPATIGAKQQPARLADGEFVIPARIVSELGNGSTEAGAKKLYAMMDRVQKARGKTTGKNKVAANSRADKYLPA